MQSAAAVLFLCSCVISATVRVNQVPPTCTPYILQDRASVSDAYTGAVRAHKEAVQRLNETRSELAACKQRSHGYSERALHDCELRNSGERVQCAIDRAFYTRHPHDDALRIAYVIVLLFSADVRLGLRRATHRGVLNIVRASCVGVLLCLLWNFPVKN